MNYDPQSGLSLHETLKQHKMLCAASDDAGFSSPQTGNDGRNNHSLNLESQFISIGYVLSGCDDTGATILEHASNDRQNVILPSYVAKKAIPDYAPLLGKQKKASHKAPAPTAL